jgi:ribose-phosphate pyrophosphokinase
MTDQFFSRKFTTTTAYHKAQEEMLEGPNGWLLFVACNSGIELAENIKREYEALFKQSEGNHLSIPLIGSKSNPITRTFSDSETCPRLPVHVAGANAFVFQNIHENISERSVNENIQQLIQVVRTLQTHRARNITVVLPYSPYSRQDKPSFMKRESALAKLFADQLKASGADVCMTYHPHTLTLHGFYEPEIRFVALSGLDLFQSIFSHMKGQDDVIVVSTDAGGAKTTVHFADSMKTSYAISSKFRQAKDQSNIIGIIGDFENKKKAIIVDDETVTATSIVNAVKNLNEQYEINEIYVGVSHYKMTHEYIHKFIEAHEKFGLKELHITDTIPQDPELLNYDFIKQHGLSQIFASTINKLHYNQSVSEIFSRL